MSVVQKIKDATIPSVYAGVAGVGLYYLFIDNNLSAQTFILGKEVPTWAAISTSVFVGAQAGGVLTEFAIPKIPVLKDMEGSLANILPAVTAGLSTFGAMYLLNSDQVPLGTAFALGAGSDVIGKYASGTMMAR